MDSVGTLSGTVCSDCIHCNVCKLASVHEDMIAQLSQFLDNYGDASYFVMDLKCRHYADRGLNNALYRAKRLPDRCC